MRRIGIFAKTFPESALEEVLDNIFNRDIDLVHFNLTCAGSETLPEKIEDSLYLRVRSLFERRRLKMAAISGTYNVIDSDISRRVAMTRRAIQLISNAREFGTQRVTLCTGTRCRHSMWKSHPDNAEPESWREMTATLEQLLVAAEANAVTLCIEPERANVVNSAAKARQLLDQMQSQYLKVVLDAANLFGSNDLSNMRPILYEAFDLLAPDIVMVHAKEIACDLSTKPQSVGTGLLDWDAYFRGMQSINYDGPIILHNLTVSQVDDSLEFIKRQIHMAR